MTAPSSSFILSNFCTKAEFERSLLLPEAERIVAEATEAARYSSAPPPLACAAEDAAPRGGHCKCFYTDNIFSTVVQQHFHFPSREIFEAAHKEYLGKLLTDKRAALIEELKAEVDRRSSHTQQAAIRKAVILERYQRRHPHCGRCMPSGSTPSFGNLSSRRSKVSSQHSLRWAETLVSSSCPSSQQSSARSCARSLTHSTSLLDAISCLGIGRPNSMNLFGVLIDELGLSPGLIDPLVQDWLAPLCSAIPSFAEAGAATISHHKPFVVAYHEGEDKGAGLKVHTDNAEFTLNASLGPLSLSGSLAFEDGELTFYGKAASGKPRIRSAFTNGQMRPWGMACCT